MRLNELIDCADIARKLKNLYKREAIRQFGFHHGARPSVA